MWCLLGNIDPSLRPYTRQQANAILISYAQSLCLNNTCKNMRVQYKTIAKYMKAAQSFNADFIEKPTFSDQGVQHPLLTIIYAEHKLYDDVMNKREPVSEEMFRWLLLRCHPTNNN